MNKKQKCLPLETREHGEETTYSFFSLPTANGGTIHIVESETDYYEEEPDEETD